MNCLPSGYLRRVVGANREIVSQEGWVAEKGENRPKRIENPFFVISIPPARTEDFLMLDGSGGGCPQPATDPDFQVKRETHA